MYDGGPMNRQPVEQPSGTQREKELAQDYKSSQRSTNKMAGLFGSELLDPIGVPGIWFPFGIGVSRTQYVYAIAIPLLAFLIVRSELSKETASLSGNHGSWSRPSLAIKS